MKNSGLITQLDEALGQLRLHSFSCHHEKLSVRAQKEGWSYSQYLLHLAQIEVEERLLKKIERMQKRSDLPKDKTAALLDLKCFAMDLRRQFQVLTEGNFIAEAENILAFGLPGVGKTHFLCAIGHELVLKGHTVFFSPAFRLVEKLLQAKKSLVLDRYLKRLDHFEVLILDDIGYIQQSRDEMEVLFTFLAERYERRSVMISSNLVFSQWEQIFRDPMTTAAVIDRLVHHSTILEFGNSSYRAASAKAKNNKKKLKKVS